MGSWSIACTRIDHYWEPQTEDYSRNLKTPVSLHQNCSRLIDLDDDDGGDDSAPGSWARIPVTVLYPFCTSEIEVAHAKE